MTEPTPHNNPDVIAAINAAMDDWEHAGDAFRYVAPWDEPVVRDPRGPVEEAMAHGWDGYAASAPPSTIRYARRWMPVVRDEIEDWHRANIRYHEPVDPNGRTPWLYPETGRPW